MKIPSTPRFANISTVRYQLRRSAALLGILPMTSARADSGWDGVGMLYFFGLLPLLMLLGAFVISLFISPAPRLHKAWTGIAIIGTVMAITLPAMAGAIDPPLYATPLVWILPALAWAAMSRRLKRRQPQ
jgi:hypothetical protein